MFDRFRQRLGQGWERRRPADGVAATHRGLDIQIAQQTSPLYNIHLNDYYWTWPLPEDVTHYLIESFLLSDPVSLRTLASSCRCLSLLCRPLVFRVVTILPIVNDRTSHAKDFSLIIQKSPEIKTFIHDLRVLDVWGALSQLSKPKSSALKVHLEEYSASLVDICTQSFPVLQRCRLDIRTSWETLPAHLVSAFERLLTTPTLRHLAYVSGGIPPAAMRAHFQNLKSLAFSGYGPITDAAQDLAESKRADISKLSLRHLHYIDVTTSATLTQSISTAIDFSTLRSLHISLLHPTPITQTSQSLSQLEELTIQSDVYMISGFADTLDLSPLRSLKTLQVNVDVSMSTRPFLRRITNIAAIFQCAPQTVIKMGIGLKERDFTYTDEFNAAWHTLDTLFNTNLRDSWPNLQQFHISYFDCPDEDKAVPGMEKYVEDIRRALPRLDALGLLTAEIHRDDSLYLSLYHCTDDGQY